MLSMNCILNIYVFIITVVGNSESLNLTHQSASCTRVLGVLCEWATVTQLVFSCHCEWFSVDLVLAVHSVDRG